ncbi:MAG: RnfABCDGE type electron transport complex subunit B [Candidatus Omnitrophica bacterium]|nr:RnfABCDGE type electron transport complex subunit B [Candidatus Omnitrophota bacterium]
MSLIAPIVTLTGLGIVFGVGLALAAKKLSVQTDPRVEEIFGKLPGVNCGACGMAGCMGFAEGLIEGKCMLERCPVTEESARKLIAGILGIEHAVRQKTVAVLHCHGGKPRAKDKYQYRGIRECAAATLVMGGPKQCAYGCIGFGSCMRACFFGAISMGQDDLPVVDEEKCTACGRCVASCPAGLFTLVPVQKNFAVRCKSQDFGKTVMDACRVGCIACRKCEKACPLGAIKITDNCAIIDYAVCENKGECVKVCPTNAIAYKVNGQWRGRA